MDFDLIFKTPQPMFMMVPVVPPPGNYDQVTQKSQVNGQQDPQGHQQDRITIIPNIDNTDNDRKNNANSVISASNPVQPNTVANSIHEMPSLTPLSTNDQSQQPPQQFVQTGTNDVNSNNASDAPPPPSAPQHREQHTVNNPVLQQQQDADSTSIAISNYQVSI